MTHLADLHPTHATEPTPFYDQLAREKARARLTVVDTGHRGPRRKSPTRLRILNESPLLYAVTGGA